MNEDVSHYTPAGPVVQKGDARNDFMCECNDEGKEQCEAVIKDVIERHGWTREELTSSVVFWLTWGSNAIGSITGLPCDMWFAVIAEAETEDKKTSYFIQCDKIEAGLARLVQMVEEDFPND